MERKFIIENEQISIPEDKILHYYLIGDEFYFQENETLLKYEGKLYISEKGVICDSLNCSLTVPLKLTDKNGKAKLDQNEFVAKESEEGFIYNNKLYLCDMLEELF